EGSVAERTRAELISVQPHRAMRVSGMKAEHEALGRFLGLFFVQRELAEVITDRGAFGIGLVLEQMREAHRAGGGWLPPKPLPFDARVGGVEAEFPVILEANDIGHFNSLNPAGGDTLS